MFDIIGYIFASSNTTMLISFIYLLWECKSQKKWKPIIWMLFFYIFLGMSNIALKQLFKIPRPHNPASYGFPSGHMTTFTLTYGWICYRCISVIKSSWKWLLLGMYCIILPIGGLWIVAKGYHTIWDIMGGFAFGNLWLLLSVLFVRRFSSSI
ncbi:MAG: phosphatase PAP2 family protein [Alphaproteobacteria bacterium]|nr:MAG: phosphatase PAP2 family protein [Alphaproteobacteria bacterium]